MCTSLRPRPLLLWTPPSPHTPPHTQTHTHTHQHHQTRTSLPPQLECLAHKRELNAATASLGDAQRRMDRLMDQLCEAQAVTKADSGGGPGCLFACWLGEGGRLAGGNGDGRIVCGA